MKQVLNKSNIFPAVRTKLADYQMGGGGDIKGFPNLKSGNKNAWSGLGAMFTETVGPMAKKRSSVR